MPLLKGFGMAVGIDGHGWIGHDANGNVVTMTDEELRQERIQREADARRVEKLYVSDEYQVFFLTKQPGTDPDAGRKAYISVRPFNLVPAEALDELRKTAEPWNSQASQVRIAAEGDQLVFHDQITNTQSKILIGELDAEVRQRLRGGQGVVNAWDKLFTAAAAANPAAAVTTKDDVAVHRPLSLRKSAPVL